MTGHQELLVAQAHNHGIHIAQRAERITGCAIKVVTWFNETDRIMHQQYTTDYDGVLIAIEQGYIAQSAPIIQGKVTMTTWLEKGKLTITWRHQ